MQRAMSTGGLRMPPSGVSMPGRPSPVIRMPQREESSLKSGTPMDPHTGKPQMTLYVDSKRCKYSMELCHSVQDVYKIPVNIVDLQTCSQVPSWMKGTPSIVVGKDVYCGDTAFMYVESLSHSMSQPSRPEQASVQDIVAGKGRKNDNKGCGLSEAFSAPPQISEEEASKKYSGSVDDALAKLMQDRR